MMAIRESTPRFKYAVDPLTIPVVGPHQQSSVKASLPTSISNWRRRTSKPRLVVSTACQIRRSMTQSKQASFSSTTRS